MQADLLVQGQCSPQNEFQKSQGYTEKTCPEEKKKIISIPFLDSGY